MPLLKRHLHFYALFYWDKFTRKIMQVFRTFGSLKLRNLHYIYRLLFLAQLRDIFRPTKFVNQTSVESAQINVTKYNIYYTPIKKTRQNFI